MADEMNKKTCQTDLLKMVTCQAPVNIAVIKYWGKRDEELILPLNSSLSVTLGIDELHSITTVAASQDFCEDCLWLNGRKHDIAEMPRIQKCLTKLRELSKSNPQNEHLSDLVDCHIHICSENNFPTAAGLASSAAGYSCLVFALSRLFQINGEISRIARQGSGSACRSMFGGFVAWEKGEMEDGSDSIAKQIASQEHWTGLRVLILVVSDQQKGTGSTEGMKRSVDTSVLLKLRAELCVPQRMEVMKKAILERDFKSFAETTMKESNQLHAVCQDTYPPIAPPYMNQTSHRIVQLVTEYNNFCGTPKVAYTFDAGPNACLFLMESDIPEILALVKYYFPPETDHGFVRGIGIQSQWDLTKNLLNSITLEPSKGAVKYVISTKVGSGPRELAQEYRLLNEHGMPISCR
ncbi:diphosphomevalonate decarboxylase-like [Montipora capricornis]|uniref:diphosphomevalonate decarboxylase-like n=1 Tax=Montipora capricornis TaxID=246305 RepID=UPI0035F10A51